ncbi:MAG: DUF2058 domain-containing protein [Gammaproteobacteria bacterium]|nr:DUF2058 domain-containing protein [Gammaproteobacteria bacterium]
MRNALQDQLLKAGLVAEKKLKEANRAKAKEKKLAGKGAEFGPSEDAIAASQAMAEKQRRDRELAEQQKQEAAAKETAAQVRQLIDHYKQPKGGDQAYNFSDKGKIKTLHVSAKLRDQLVRGQLIVVRSGDSYELVPKVAAEKIKERDESFIVLWNLPAADAPAEDDPYKDFPIPDDLMW